MKVCCNISDRPTTFSPVKGSCERNVSLSPSPPTDWSVRFLPLYPQPRLCVSAVLSGDGHNAGCLCGPGRGQTVSNLHTETTETDVHAAKTGAGPRRTKGDSTTPTIIAGWPPLIRRASLAPSAGGGMRAGTCIIHSQAVHGRAMGVGEYRPANEKRGPAYWILREEEQWAESQRAGRGAPEDFLRWTAPSSSKKPAKDETVGRVSLPIAAAGDMERPCTSPNKSLSSSSAKLMMPTPATRDLQPDSDGICIYLKMWMYAMQDPSGLRLQKSQVLYE
ncbi:hypothetical protein N7462_003003 [Penicillium macrosclerotiorum]|uniref:uncharacterized protein n=1 Tax=Penicillium macrosclerotiorum TaxID=303699 RepID=UPI0025481B02|nr:uncharacterized protein N7462_003003 [Penicillium macrosclerotiorum]KAJ5688611.1 hypothetical protein N7462_003003 [Penicillium macrosclerotiorum]